MRSVILSLTCLLFFLFIDPASAALPPLDDAQRLQRASEVVSGQIEALYRRSHKLKEGFSNEYLLLEIVVKKSHKGELGPDSILLAECWIVDERPETWVGDWGQEPVPREGASGRFYLEKVRTGLYRLLSPNGWDEE